MKIFRNLQYRLHDAWYKLRCRLWHRYNVVVCRSLPPTWHDRDYLLLHSSFQILEDFIRKEEPWEFTGDVYTTYVADVGEESALERAAEWQAVLDLFIWWQARKNNDYDEDYDEDSRMLHKLINIRGCLWT